MTPQKRCPKWLFLGIRSPRVFHRALQAVTGAILSQNCSIWPPKGHKLGAVWTLKSAWRCSIGRSKAVTGAIMSQHSLALWVPFFVHRRFFPGPPTPPRIRQIISSALLCRPAPPHQARARFNFSLCSARKQNQKIFSVLCAKAKIKFSPRFARNQA